MYPSRPGPNTSSSHRIQKKGLMVRLDAYGRNTPALFIGFPGDEDAYGGCLAAGRGFVHIGPSGNLKPCPAAPVSDANLPRVAAPGMP